MKPTIGRIVHVQIDKPEFFRSTHSIHAALVLGVNDDDTINALVFPDSPGLGTVYLGHVPEKRGDVLLQREFGDALLGAGWFWPPREPSALELGAAVRAAGEAPMIRTRPTAQELEKILEEKPGSVEIGPDGQVMVRDIG